MLLKNLLELLRIKFTNDSVSKNVYINELDDIVNKCIDKYHSTINIKSVDVHYSTNVDFDKEHNKDDPKFEVDDHVRI